MLKREGQEIDDTFLLKRTRLLSQAERCNSFLAVFARSQIVLLVECAISIVDRKTTYKSNC